MSQSQFLLTVADVSQFPKLFNGLFMKGHRQPRMAMVGRSNVGKSTLINALLGRRLAQTSNQPGKTRAIHFYLWGKGNKIIADLPGYGFAKASHVERNRWNSLIELYIEQDSHLERVVHLLDARHGPTDVDLKAMEFLSLKNIPVTFVFTKIDSLKTQAERSRRKKEVAEIFSRLGIDSSQVFWVSSQSRAGLKPLAQYLSNDLQLGGSD